MGLAVAGCGASVGGMVFPVIAKYTINTMGRGSTLWISCGVVTFCSLVIQVLVWKAPKCKNLTNEVHPKFTWSRVIEWRAFKDVGYASYVLAMFFVFVGVWIPFCKFYVLLRKR